MKTIGLMGGMSWESTELYYRLLNEGMKERLGGLHSAKIAMVSVEFHDMEKLQVAGDWDQAGVELAKAAEQIEAAGADFLLICSNTMHIVAPAIEEAISIPLLHLADATAQAILEAGLKTVGLLGTAFTMEQDFYRKRIEQRGLTVLIPEAADRAIVHNVIYKELVLGIVTDESRAEYIRIIDELAAAGAEGIIEGCTEIGMLVKPEHTDVPLFDTTIVHAQAAVDYALE